MVGALVKTGVIDQLARSATDVTGGNALLTVMLILGVSARCRASSTTSPTSRR